MKLTSIHIENFKAVRNLAIDFHDAEGDQRFLTAFLGDNGSGKTTVLQAVALTLGLATAKFRSTEDFGWPGFVSERVGSLGRTRVDLKVAFSKEEREATVQAFELLKNSRLSQSATWITPGDLAEVTLRFENGRVQALEGQEGYFQFRGRSYVRQLDIPFLERRKLFSEIGDVFYFDQFRSLETSDPPSVPNETDRGSLREQLVGALSTRRPGARPAPFDLIQELEKQLGRVFPNLRFDAAEPRNEGDFSPRNMFVFLRSQERRFDISEMSSGQQAIFPLLWQFVGLTIARSIVLIDELELHLHPPYQQALLRALRNLGQDCQFLITTHSPFLEELIPNEWEIRLPGGTLCL